MTSVTTWTCEKCGVIVIMILDDHDVLEFSVYSLNTEMPKPPGTLPQAEQQKYDAEFEKQMQDYEKERQKWVACFA